MSALIAISVSFIRISLGIQAVFAITENSAGTDSSVKGVQVLLSCCLSYKLMLHLKWHLIAAQEILWFLSITLIVKFSESNLKSRLCSPP